MSRKFPLSLLSVLLAFVGVFHFAGHSNANAHLRWKRYNYGRQHSYQKSSNHPKAKTVGTSADFPAYLLALTYVSGFCKHNDSSNAEHDCNKIARSGSTEPFLLHGLWPSLNHPIAAKFLSSCTDEPLITTGSGADGFRKYVKVSLSGEPLAQHEWSKHGTCSHLSQNEYFSLASTAYEKYKSMISAGIAKSYRKSLSYADLANSFDIQDGERYFRFFCYQTTSKGDTCSQSLTDVAVMIDRNSLKMVPINDGFALGSTPSECNPKCPITVDDPSVTVRN